MQKIITKTVDDLAIDPSEVVDVLNTACNRRHEKYTLRGICQVDDIVYFVLLPREPSESARTYVLDTVDATSRDDVVAMLDSRWASNFDAVGTVKVYDTTYILFSRPAADSAS